LNLMGIFAATVVLSGMLRAARLDICITLILASGDVGSGGIKRVASAGFDHRFLSPSAAARV
jgi:hypothetical protein